MNISISSDHRGYRAKQRIAEMLRNAQHQVEDCGCDSAESCDYPDMAKVAAGRVSKGESDRAILICGTGLGMSIAANKLCGVRAALCHDELTAQFSRKHNDANVLCLPADLIGEQLISLIVNSWLETKFEGGRHARRIEKIHALEKENCD
ncbi:MAG: ribose 5-phosphate isomerase B [Phycisphaerae bacterium]|nr:MAG: ribose 5-phosphate isomerase B [Phycisphaerae bacterium]